MKKILALVLTLILALGTCAAVAEGLKIGVSIVDLANVFYVDIQDGMKQALKDGDEMIVTDADFDQATQINQIEDMIQQGCNVVLLDPVDSSAIRGSLEALAAANIPVVCFNSPVEDTDLVASTVATDNYLAGQLIGQKLADELGGKGQIAMLTYDVAVVCFDRAEGFKSVIDQYPDMEIVVRQEITPGTDTALPVMENILQTYPDITGVFCLNDPSALGAAAAVQAAGKADQIKIVGVDGSEDGKAGILDGRLLASAAQSPVEIGKIAVETAYAVLDGQEVEKDVKVPSFLVDATNAAE